MEALDILDEACEDKVRVWKHKRYSIAKELFVTLGSSHSFTETGLVDIEKTLKY